uniref:Cysteine synthase n=1 Tax=Solanum tuberosum TaxID=4113 RepID=M1B970_SOLTU
MTGIVKKAYELLESTPNAFMLQQFYNPANTQDHFDTTCPEIWEETLGNIDLTLCLYGFEPTESNILNGGKPGHHQITGKGVGFKPDILGMDLMEEHRHWKSSEGFPR